MIKKLINRFNRESSLTKKHCVSSLESGQHKAEEAPKPQTGVDTGAFTQQIFTSKPDITDEAHLNRYIASILSEIRQHIDLVNYTVHPITYFYSLNMALDGISELCKYENSVAYKGKLPSKNYREILMNIGKSADLFIDRYLAYIRLELLEYKEDATKEKWYQKYITTLYDAFNNANSYYPSNGVYPHYTAQLFADINLFRVQNLYENIETGLETLYFGCEDKETFSYPEGFKDKQPLVHNGQIILVDKAPSTRESRIYRKAEEAWLEEHYDLNTAEGIQAIPEVENPPKWPGCGPMDVTGDIDYYLRFKSAEYEKARNIELAILCLQKSNAIRMVRKIGYRKGDYYRLIRLLAQNGRVEEAYQEKEKIDALFGPYHADSVKKVLDSLISFKKYADAEDLRLNSIEEAKKDKEYLENVIPFEIQRGQDMRDFDWLQANLPGICPKSLTGYRRMKKQNTKNYQKIVDEARKLGYEIEHEVETSGLQDYAKGD